MKIKSMTCVGQTIAQVAVGAPVTDDSGKEIGKVTGGEVKPHGYIEVSMEITDKATLDKLGNLFVGKQ